MQNDDSNEIKEIKEVANDKRATEINEKKLDVEQGIDEKKSIENEKEKSVRVKVEIFAFFSSGDF